MNAGWPRRLVDALLLVAGLAAMVWMGRHLPNTTENQAPFAIRGKMDETVRARTFAARVERVELARTLVVPGVLSTQPPKRIETGGVWVLVHTRIDPLREAVSPAGARLRSRGGVSYTADDGRVDLRYRLNGGEVMPGEVGRGVLLFEVPPQRIAGASLLLREAKYAGELDSELEIDLGLTEARVREMLRAMPDALSLRRTP